MVRPPAGVGGAGEINADGPLIDRGPFNVGEKIEGNFGGKGIYRSATVVRRRLNGSYDLDYDDGEKEQVVEVDMIRARGSGRPTVAAIPAVMMNAANAGIQVIRDPVAALTIPTARLNVNGVRLKEGKNVTTTIPNLIPFQSVNNHTLTLKQLQCNLLRIESRGELSGQG